MSQNTVKPAPRAVRRKPVPDFDFECPPPVPPLSTTPFNAGAPGLESRPSFRLGYLPGDSLPSNQEASRSPPKGRHSPHPEDPYSTHTEGPFPMRSSTPNYYPTAVAEWRSISATSSRGAGGWEGASTASPLSSAPDRHGPSSHPVSWDAPLESNLPEQHTEGGILPSQLQPAFHRLSLRDPIAVGADSNNRVHRLSVESAQRVWDLSPRHSNDLSHKASRDLFRMGDSGKASRPFPADTRSRATATDDTVSLRRSFDTSAYPDAAAGHELSHPFPGDMRSMHSRSSTTPSFRQPAVLYPGKGEVSVYVTTLRAKASSSCVFSGAAKLELPVAIRPHHVRKSVNLATRAIRGLKKGVELKYGHLKPRLLASEVGDDDLNDNIVLAYSAQSLSHDFELLPAKDELSARSIYSTQSKRSADTRKNPKFTLVKTDTYEPTFSDFNGKVVDDSASLDESETTDRRLMVVN